ncbi:hypothetical protein IWW45_000705 [Coemansia sp. RSA 485]|nr:hypothetical protein IWW45_000705 [Coemansia sp. RSA 485]
MTDMGVIQGIDLHKCSVLNLMGARDKIVPVEDCWEYDRLLRSAAPDASKVVTKVVPFASHFWATPPELAELSRIISEWIDKQI